MKNKLLLIFIFFSTINLFSLNLDEGIDYLKNENFDMAISFFNDKLVQDQNDENIYIFLSFAYEKKGDLTMAVEILKKGYYKISGSNLSYNLANVLFLLANYQEAVFFYTKSIEFNAFKNMPYLNRANSYVKLEKYDEALLDYKKYLSITENDSQEENIKRIIEILERKIKEKEDLEKIKAENERREKERLDALLKETNQALENRDESKNLYLDSTELEDYNFDIDILE